MRIFHGQLQKVELLPVRSACNVLTYEEDDIHHNKNVALQTAYPVNHFVNQFTLGVTSLTVMGFEAQSEATPLTPEQEEQLKGLALERAPKDLAALDDARTEDELFYALPSAAVAAFRLGNSNRAKQLAERALEMAPVYAKSWNYGNSIHAAHTVLGLLALAEGNISTAIDELGKAGATPGSPQLHSFGPTMQLAKELLRCGQSEPVLAYFKQCRSFWKMGGVWLDLWENKVRAGGIPNFFMHCYR